MPASNDLFPPSEFDAWAEHYDRSVCEESVFPFAGYERVLQKIVELSHAQHGQAVLDLGAGTGNLGLYFTKQGCDLTCTDFSEAMLAKARLKLPQARFLLHDLRAPLFAGRFDAIVSAYVFHHFPLEQKIEICARLIRDQLVPAGKLVIGDISFASQAALKDFKRTIRDWDDEFYWLADQSLAAFEKAGLELSYIQVSACAGVYTLLGRR